MRFFGTLGRGRIPGGKARPHDIADAAGRENRPFGSKDKAEWQKGRACGPAFASNPDVVLAYLHLAIEASAAEMPFSEKT